MIMAFRRFARGLRARYFGPESAASGAVLLSALAACLAADLVASPASAAEDTTTLDIRLFRESDIPPPAACRVTLWQANRDPGSDRFATVFLEDLDFDHLRAPARLRIGDDVVNLTRIATGGAAAGYDLHAVQLYRSADGDTRVILDLAFAPEEGEAVEIESGKLTIVRQGFLPFRMDVKGGAGCMVPAAAGDPAAGEDDPVDFSNLFQKYQVRPGDVPEALLQRLAEVYDCDWRAAIDRFGVTGYQTSEEGAIWELGCALGMHNVAYAYAQVYLFDPGEHTLLSFQNVKGHPRMSPYILFNPVWDMERRVVSSFTVDRGLGDCGTFERHRLVDAEFRMIEYRAKPECDGNAMEPEAYPLIYSR
ncbi:DUF1176 domain-containing protein [Stappia sp.]|uniref:DUF1176 domain-containing protein n=1 Tax=Stappia sp. TaxID=1870903 RepID=UPI0032D8C9D1